MVTGRLLDETGGKRVPLARQTVDSDLRLWQNREGSALLSRARWIIDFRFAYGCLFMVSGTRPSGMRYWFDLVTPKQLLFFRPVDRRRSGRTAIGAGHLEEVPGGRSSWRR